MVDPKMERKRSQRIGFNAEDDMRRGTIFDRSARRRGNYDMRQDRMAESRFGPGKTPTFPSEEWDEPYSDFDMYPSRDWLEEDWNVPGPFTGRGPKNYRRSDDRILEDVCDRLLMHGQINAADLEVEVHNGNVYLNGQIDSRHAKHAAENITAAVSGVNDVHNRLRVMTQDETRRMLEGDTIENQRLLGTGHKIDRLHSLEDLFFEELMDLYDAEKQLVKALTKMAEAAHSDDLKRGFREHLDQTHRQIDRLEQIFNEHGRSIDGKTCIGMQGIIAEGELLMNARNADPDVQDAGLIAAAQKAEHYEIATYGTVRTYAQQLGKDKAATLLNQTLDEESKTNEKLTSMAVGHINIEAKRS
jgi:ferritin-like metal-binding protein YciE